MAQNISLLGANYSDVPAVNLPKTGGGTARFTDTTPTTAIEADVASGKVFIKADGSSAVGTNSGSTPTLETVTKTYTPTTSQQTETITPSSGYDGIGEVDVTVNAMPVGSVIIPDIATQGSSSYSTGDTTLSIVAGSLLTPVVTTPGYVTTGTERGVNINITTTIPVRTSDDLVRSAEDTIKAPAGYYPNAASKNIPAGTQGTPTATKGTVVNNTVTITPSVTNQSGYISGGTHNGTPITVSASELVSGSETKTANGTYDVTNLAELVVNVSGGGASNIVEGTFTTGSSAGAHSVTLSYTGNGYPIAAMVFINGGAYNPAISGWYNSVQKYAVGFWSMSKSVMTSSPTYDTSGVANQGVATAIYKNSTSSSTIYTRTSGMSTNVYSSYNANYTALNCVRFKSGNVLSYYVNTSSYGLLPNMEYKYIVIYSE